MKKILFCLSLILPTIAFADDFSKKMGYVDIHYIENECVACKDLKDQIDKKIADFQTKIGKKEEELVKKSQALQKQRAVLSEPDFSKKIEEISTQESDLKRQFNNGATEIDKALMVARTQLNEKISEVINGLASEKGLTVVFATDGLLYIKENLDLTPEVLKKIDQKLQKIQLKFDGEAVKK